MSKKTYYQYVILWHPNEEQEKNGDTTKKLKEGEIFSASPKTAEMQVIQEIPKDYLKYVEGNQLEVLLRPF